MLDTCYKNGLLAVLLRYLEENCDIITNYDYILSLLSLLALVPVFNRPERVYTLRRSRYAVLLLLSP